MTLSQWLAQKMDEFELRVRAGRMKDGTNTYWCAGWARGYMAAKAEARKAARSQADGLEKQ